MPPKDTEAEVQASEAAKQEAENGSVKDTAANTGTPAGSDDGEGSESKIDGKKLAEKLQARLTKEQADKNDYKNKYEEAAKELERLKKGKSVKQLHAEDENQKALADKDKQIKELQSKIQRSETLKQVDGIFKDAGLSVGDDVLGLVVTDDNEATVANAKAIINLVNKSYEEGRKTILKGKTPRVHTGKSISTKDPRRMSLMDRVKLQKEDPEEYRELFRS
jgi:hypothetical protein